MYTKLAENNVTLSRTGGASFAETPLDIFGGKLRQTSSFKFGGS